MEDSPMDERTRTDSLDRRAFLERAGGALAIVAAGMGVLPAWGRSWRAGVPASPFEWAEVRPGVFATGQLASGGNCLVTGGDGRCLLVDTKFPVFARRLARDAESMVGLAPTHVVNTHHHADHSGGNLAFTRDAVVLAHENGGPRVLAQFERNMAGVTGAARMAGRVDEAFRGELIADAGALLAGDELGPGSWAANTPVSASRTGLDLGGRWVEIRHFGRPSHTDNDLVIRLVDDNVIHTGDVVFNGLHPYFDANGGASSAGWLETLTDIDDLCDDETVVVPGHGPAGGREIVRAQIRYIEQLRESVKRGIDGGTPLDELRSRTFPFMEGMGLENLRENAIVFVYNELTGG
jgi:cyclase